MLLKALQLLGLLLLRLPEVQTAQLPSVPGVGARAAAVYQIPRHYPAVPGQQVEQLFGMLGRHQQLWGGTGSLAAQ